MNILAASKLLSECIGNINCFVIMTFQSHNDAFKKVI